MMKFIEDPIVLTLKQMGLIYGGKKPCGDYCGTLFGCKDFTGICPQNDYTGSCTVYA